MTQVLTYNSDTQTIEDAVLTEVTEVAVVTPPSEGAKSVLKFLLDDIEYFAEQTDSNDWVSDLGKMRTIIQ